jgi:hypothetical protein
VNLLIVPFCSCAGEPNFPQLPEKNGGDDETRTRDLCRDSGPLKGFTTTYKTAGTAKGRLSCSKSHKTPHCVGWVVG